MQKDLQTLFDRHEKPSRCSTDDVHKGIAPVASLLANIQAQLAEYRALIVAAELSDHDHDIDPKLNMLHNQLDGMDAAASEIIGKWRTLARSLVGFDRAMLDAKEDIANVEQRRADKQVAATAARTDI